jgi:hypothetical protein
MTIHILWRYGLATQLYLDLFPIFSSFIPKIFVHHSSDIHSEMKSIKDEMKSIKLKKDESKIKVALKIFQLLDSLVVQTIPQRMLQEEDDEVR